MGTEHSTPIVRRATSADAMKITLLYQQVYQGLYPNPLMRNPAQLASFLEQGANVWVIAEIDGTVAASVVYETDPNHRVARVFGGAVLPEYRGLKLLELTMKLGQQQIIGANSSCDVVYATTRTSHQAAQIVTDKLGYKKLGIFPNVHRTDTYETHCLTALYAESALDRRASSFNVHPCLTRLFELVRSECGLAPQPPATPEDLQLDDYHDTMDLELITAKKYALHQFESQKDGGLLQAHFYPFHTPNMVISSPNREIEVFLYAATEDQYCTIIGIKKPRTYNFTWLLDACSSLLRASGVRYIEILVRADKAKTVERVLRSRFIPCAYFPAFQLLDGQRHDFVIFSRTFEIVDCRNLQLTGKNVAYLEEYLINLQEYYLKPQLPG